MQAHAIEFWHRVGPDNGPRCDCHRWRPTECLSFHRQAQFRGLHPCRDWSPPNDCASCRVSKNDQDKLVDF